MPIEEVREAAGSWDLTLLPETPRSVLRGIGWNSYIVVMLTGRPAAEEATVETLLAESDYTGYLQDKELNTGSRGEHIIRGNGLAQLLGDDDFAGQVMLVHKRERDRTIGYYLNNYVFPTNGITLGENQALSATRNYRIERGADRLTVLNDVCDIFNAHWRITHAATARVGRGPWLWRGWDTDPKVIITDYFAEEFIDPVDEMTVINARRIGSRESSRRLRTHVYVKSLSEPSAAARYALPDVPTFKTLSGGNLVSTQYIPHDRVENSTVAAWVCLKKAERFDHTHIELDVSVSGYGWLSKVTPGDKIWVYSPDADIYSNDNHVYIAGVDAHPRKVAVMAKRWPLPPDATVVHINSDSGRTITDLTPWIDRDAESIGVTLELGDLKREAPLRTPRYR
jgi:hypothetical protein